MHADSTKRQPDHAARTLGEDRLDRTFLPKLLKRWESARRTRVLFYEKCAQRLTGVLEISFETLEETEKGEAETLEETEKEEAETLEETEKEEAEALEETEERGSRDTEYVIVLSSRSSAEGLSRIGSAKPTIESTETEGENGPGTPEKSCETQALFTGGRFSLATRSIHF